MFDPDGPAVMSETEASSACCGNRPTPMRCRHRARGARRARSRTVPCQRARFRGKSTASTKSGRSPRSCMPRGSAFSNCRGTCFAPAAAACSARARPQDRRPRRICLRALRRGYEPTLDEMVEVTFTSARGPPDRRARSAGRCPKSNIPADFLGLGRRPAGRSRDSLAESSRSTRSSCRPREGAVLSVQLPAEFVIVFDPVTHAAQFIDVKGEPTRERQTLSIVFNRVKAPTTDDRDAARDRCAVARKPHRRAPRAAGLWIAGDAAPPARLRAGRF
jgi:hypothetical protein